MHLRSRALLALGLASALMGLGATAAVAADDRPMVMQAGTYDYLATPNYTGLTSIGSVIAGQTLGLGTFDRLDGEFVMVGGEGYRIGVDGVPQKVALNASTPFVQSVRFAPEHSGPVAPGTTCAQLPDVVNSLAHSTQGVVAVRVRGTFTGLTTRSVPGFSEPYPTLTQAVAQQTTFDLSGRKAVLVGFRTGPDFAGVGAAGLHLHGVTADRKAGGHVLNCVAGNDVHVSIETTAGVTIVD